MLNKSTNSTVVGSFNRYLAYLGIPAAVGLAMCKIFNCCFDKSSVLQGKVVVVTGASSGLGEALAHVLYEKGCKLILAARRKVELERVKNDLVSKNLSTPTFEPVVLELDLAQLEGIEPFVQKVYDVCGHIDILINNGGVSHRGSIRETKIEVDQKIMAVNYFGAVALTKACLSKMIERKAGHIAFVSSVQGLVAIPERSAYAASKHAMQAFGDSLRAEMHQHNINVTMISPGYVKTAISINAYSGSGDAHGVMDPSTASGYSPEYVAKKIVCAIVGKQNELIVSQFIPRLAIFLRHSMPSLYFYVMARRANRIT